MYQGKTVGLFAGLLIVHGILVNTFRCIWWIFSDTEMTYSELSGYEASGYVHEGLRFHQPWSNDSYVQSSI